MDTRRIQIDTDNIGHKTQKDTFLSFFVLCPLLHLSFCMFVVSIVSRVYLSVSCVQCYPCLSFCVLCPMLHVSVFLCLVSNVTRVYLSVSCVHSYPCLSVCVLCPMIPVSIFLCLVSNVTRVSLSVSCVDTRHIQINTGRNGHKTHTDRHV
jgi:hypothetical protein